MLWDSLADVRRYSRLESERMEKRHYYVKLPSGKWTRTLDSPPKNAECVAGRVYKLR